MLCVASAVDGGDGGGGVVFGSAADGVWGLAGLRGARRCPSSCRPRRWGNMPVNRQLNHELGLLRNGNYKQQQLCNTITEQ